MGKDQERRLKGIFRVVMAPHDTAADAVDHGTERAQEFSERDLIAPLDEILQKPRVGTTSRFDGEGFIWNVIRDHHFNLNVHRGTLCIHHK